MLFAGSPVTVYEVPLPEYVVPPGVRVIVHDPEEGSPLRTTLPVGRPTAWLINDTN